MPPVAPHPEQFPQLMDRMGELMRKDYDWRPEIEKLRMPTLLLFADHDAVSMRHIAEFFALFDGGVRDAGWEGTPKARPRSTRDRAGLHPLQLWHGPGHRARDRGVSGQPHVEGDSVHAVVSAAMLRGDM